MPSIYPRNPRVGISADHKLLEISKKQTLEKKPQYKSLSKTSFQQGLFVKFTWWMLLLSSFALFVYASVFRPKSMLSQYLLRYRVE